jgi:hypothetical protein
LWIARRPSGIWNSAAGPHPSFSDLEAARAALGVSTPDKSQRPTAFCSSALDIRERPRMPLCLASL